MTEINGKAHVADRAEGIHLHKNIKLYKLFKQCGLQQWILKSNT
jgi:hypothetical protein